MPVQRYISSSFWSDDWIDSLTITGKLLYMYLLTNECTNIAGVYKITIKRIKDDTGITREEIQTLLKDFENRKKVFYLDEYIVLPKWPKHQKLGEREKLRLGVISILQRLPQNIFNELQAMGYSFDLSVVHATIIGRNEREGLSGTRRSKIFAERGNKCETCGSTEKLVIHRKKLTNDSESNDNSNFTVLCSLCHDRIHNPQKQVIVPDIISGTDSENCGQHGKSTDDSDYDLDIDLKNNKPDKPVEVFGNENTEITQKHLQKQTKAPHSEREPLNDYERIEKHYLNNFYKLFTLGLVQTEKPVAIPWAKIRGMESRVLKTTTADLVITALDNALNDEWFIENRPYTLDVLLQSQNLNKYINTKQDKKKLQGNQNSIESGPVREIQRIVNTCPSCGIHLVSGFCSSCMTNYDVFGKEVV